MNYCKRVRAIIQKGEKYLLVRHRGRGYWCWPGGKVEEGETLEQALRRELREELGVEVRKFDLDSVCEFMQGERDLRSLEFWFRVEVEGGVDTEGASHGFEIEEWGWKGRGDVEVMPRNLWQREEGGRCYVNDINN